MKLVNRHGIALVAVLSLPVQATEAQSPDEAQRAQVRANFRKADADGDTALTRRAFTTLIDHNAQHEIGRARQITRLDRYDMAFSRADADADGGVTLEELSAFAAQER